MPIAWASLDQLSADSAQSRCVEIDGWFCPFEAGNAFDYFALTEEPPCCLGCLPSDPGRRIEVFADHPVAATGGPLRLAGELRFLSSDPAGWRFQLRNARVVEAAAPRLTLFTRRRLLTAAPLACVAVGAAGASAMSAAASDDPGREALADAPTVDIHSHAGGVIGLKRVADHAPFDPVAAPMRAGGMAVLCLAAVPDSPTHRIMPDRRIRPFRDPEPGELYAYGQASFQRIHDLAREQDLPIVVNAAQLAAARSDRPSIVVCSEGGDFLEGQPDRLAEAYERWRLRHLQLTHYRVNELGDIQTEDPVHGGLTAIGAEVVRRCNRLGVVVDVAHCTYDLVRQAAAVTTKPLVLSHTSLSHAPKPYSRLISPDHARAIADTGGVIGVWPPASVFPDMAALAAGIARMADAIGVDHVALGSDMRGLVGPSTFASYEDLPALSAALRARGFQTAEIRKLLGGNYLRVFTASMA